MAEMRPEIVDAAARLAIFIHNRGGTDHQHKDMVLILKELKEAIDKLEEIVTITNNSPGCDPVAAVRQIWNGATGMVKELSTLREENERLTELLGEVKTTPSSSRRWKPCAFEGCKGIAANGVFCEAHRDC